MTTVTALSPARLAEVNANVVEVMGRIAAAARAAGREPSEVTLVAVSKTFSKELVEAAHGAGLRHFGENWVQEAAAKLPQLAALTPRPIWHMVGHLQTNKVKLALELFDLIQSVDSVHLGETIARRAGGRRIPILLEVNVAGEASKQGFRPEDLPSACDRLRAIPQLDLRGLMTVAPAVDHPEAAEPVFRCLRELRDELGLQELSMGMTDDFEVAVREGATILRIGRAIFGPRSYP
jgi:pyridoxal phosphate enzyme (YggS family)